MSIPNSDRNHLIKLIDDYKTSFIDEAVFRSQFLELLISPGSFHRDHLPGHITGSAWIVDQSKQFVLLTHHAKLNRWLQPGGHADGDENVFRVAEKEAIEETGVQSLKMLESKIFDIDIHPIPARKDFPEHLHYDVRILFEANKNEKLTVTEESHDLQWIKLTDVAAKSMNNSSMIRMAEKAKKLL